MSKYSLKNIVLGIGIGFVIASMANINADSRPMTVEEIKKEAGKHNLIILTAEQVINQQRTDQDKEPAAAPTPTSAPSRGNETVTIRIESGATSEQAADLLRNAGLIDDTRRFIERLGALGKDRRLQMGEFTIRKDIGMEELIEILTR